MYDFSPILSRIKSAKADAGFTNEELSVKSGIAIGTINKILSGDTKEPKLPALMAIASALGVSVDFLIYGKQFGGASSVDESASYLLRIFGRLNEEGREEIIRHAEYISSQDKYKKDNKPCVVDKAQ